MNDYNVSVIIPAYNSAVSLPRCINSIFSQTIKPGEVIIINDGSTDNTAEVVRGYGNNIIYLEQDNQGPAAARNRGLKQTNGEFVAFLDADDYWKPQFLETTVGFLEKHPEAVAVSVGQIHKVIGKNPSVMPKIMAEQCTQLEPQVLNNFFEFWAEHNHVCTGSVMMRTEVAKKTGGQRAELRVCEDLEFWAYFATFGKWGFVPEILFVSDGTLVTQKQGWLKKNRRRWASSPTVEDWQRRILPHLTCEELKSFKMSRARIAKNLAYFMILSRRYNLARMTLCYFDSSLNDRLGNLLNVVSSYGLIPWKLLCITLRVREVIRNWRV